MQGYSYVGGGRSWNNFFWAEACFAAAEQNVKQLGRSMPWSNKAGGNGQRFGTWKKQ